MSQKKIFLKSEGDKWFLRNKSNIDLKTSLKKDAILNFLDKKKISFKSVLEIGCSNGYRLELLKQVKENLLLYGIDPSEAAIQDGKKKYNKLNLKVGTADKLEFSEEKFDLIIFGFCLYLCNRKDLIKIVYETNRDLKKKGLIVIYDFYSSFPLSNKYLHCSGVKSYKMDYSKIFLWNPEYKLIEKKIFEYKDKKKKSNNDKLALFFIKKK